MNARWAAGFNCDVKVASHIFSKTFIIAQSPSFWIDMKHVCQLHLISSSLNVMKRLKINDYTDINENIPNFDNNRVTYFVYKSASFLINKMLLYSLAMKVSSYWMSLVHFVIKSLVHHFYAELELKSVNGCLVLCLQNLTLKVFLSQLTQNLWCFLK